MTREDELKKEAAQAAADKSGAVAVTEAVERWLATQRINPTTLAA